MIATEIRTSFRFEDDLVEVEEWCLRTIGPRAEFRDQVSDLYPWTSSWSIRSTILWHFAREEDVTLFALRWT
jgi:hypothetical protein